MNNLITISHVPAFYHYQKRYNELFPYPEMYPDLRWSESHYGDFLCEIIEDYHLDYTQFHAGTYPVIGIAKIIKPPFENKTGHLAPNIVGNYCLFAYYHFLAHGNNYADYDLENVGVCFIADFLSDIRGQKNKYESKKDSAKKILDKSRYGVDKEWYLKRDHYENMYRLYQFYCYALEYAETKPEYIHAPKMKLLED